MRIIHFVSHQDNESDSAPFPRSIFYSLKKNLCRCQRHTWCDPPSHFASPLWSNHISLSKGRSSITIQLLDARSLLGSFLLINMSYEETWYQTWLLHVPNTMYQSHLHPSQCSSVKSDCLMIESVTCHIECSCFPLSFSLSPSVNTIAPLS